jgi:hypothetical protein
VRTREQNEPNTLSDLEAGTHISALQHLLKLSHSENTEDQQKVQRALCDLDFSNCENSQLLQAAFELSKLVQATRFPASSFGALAHALSRLIPSSHRNIACYAARAVKRLVVDDSLRPQVA